MDIAQHDPMKYLLAAPQSIHSVTCGTWWVFIIRVNMEYRGRKWEGIA